MTLWHRITDAVRGYDIVSPCEAGITRTGRVYGLGRGRKVYVEGDPVLKHPYGLGNTYSVWSEDGQFWCNVSRGRICGWTVKPIHRVAKGTVIKRGKRMEEMAA